MQINAETIAALRLEIIELQTKLQFQEDAMQQLDTVVVEQSGFIAKLTHRLADLEDKINDIADERDYPKSAEQEKPPHY